MWANSFPIVIFTSLISHWLTYLSTHLFVLSHVLCYFSSWLKFGLNLFFSSLFSHIYSYFYACTQFLMYSPYSLTLCPLKPLSPYHCLSWPPGQFLLSILLLCLVSISLLPNMRFHDSWKHHPTFYRLEKLGSGILGKLTQYHTTNKWRRHNFNQKLCFSTFMSHPK